MEELLYMQHSNIRSIHRFIENFKKIGKPNLTEAIVRNRIELLEKYWGFCREVHPKLERLATAEDKKTEDYFVKAHFNAAEDQYFAVSDYLSEYLALLAEQKAQAEAPANLNKTVVSEPACPVQLPRIEMPKFSGSYLEWESFSDLFESLVANNAALTDVQRLHYLKASLTGEASSILKNVAITAVNYASAWATLKARYQNQRVIIAAHLHSFVSLPNIAPDSIADLKTLRDATSEALVALKNMGRKVHEWDDLLIYLISQKLDHSTRKEWETHLGARTDNPSFDELTTFLNTRIRVLESLPFTAKRSGPPPAHSKGHSVKAHVSTTAPTKCILCSSNHALHNCPQFKAQTIPQRVALIRERNHCFNCLYPGHRPKECRSKYSCSICRRRHHTMVHGDSNAVPHANAPPQTMSTPTQVNANVTTLADQGSASATPESQITNVTAHQASGALLQSTSILLATAWVLVRSAEGRVLRVRALLDQGSERTFVTDSVAQLLRMPRQRVHASVSGVGGQTLGVVNSTVTLSVEPCHGRGPTLDCVGLVMSKLTAYTPPRCRNSNLWSHLQELELADPNPTSAAPIDLLIGADLYGAILKVGLQRGPAGALIAQETIFGWVISGPTRSTTVNIPPEITVHHCTTLDELHTSLRELFEVEEHPRQVYLTEDEQKCERHFDSTHTRAENGQYIVRLPFKDGPPIEIGESLSSAVAMWLKLEARSNRNPELSIEYHNFLRKYLELGHMEPVPTTDSQLDPAYVYIPHLPVVRESSSTTRVRVVFNASSPTSDGTSLNDHLLIGPKLQNDLPSIVLRWRMHRYAFTADVQQMYRQIRVESRDTKYQCILWRENRNQPMSAFRLLTVTYGTASAPYQALRVLKQLALDEGASYPLGAPVLNRDCYVDDVLFGADTQSEAVETRDQLIQLLASGGFHLRKFAASDPELLDGIAAEDRESGGAHVLEEHPQVKVLGLSWNPDSDSFQFRSDLEIPSTVTKREILSLTAKLFDPLGWLAPVIISAKILLQELWILGADWDSEPPAELRQRWLEYCNQLAHVDEFNIPRWTGYHSESAAYELHGFADASQRAYAAVVYLRILEPDLTARVVLLRAKTKVSPIKEVSIPRLELCAVVLLSKLLASMRETLDLTTVPVYGWTDSTVVLAWLSKHPSQWKTFVANRVSEVLTTLPEASWRHVPTASNPADCASRGLSVRELLDHTLWWHGPGWLTEHSTTWPTRPSPIAPEVDLEQRAVVSAHVATHNEQAWDLHHAISSWPRLLRVTAYCMRFINAIKTKINPHASIALTASEIAQVRLFWIRFAQTEAFSKELEALQRHRPLPSKTLSKLNPVLDKDNVLRVGGRLKNSLLSYDEKHPIILPQHRVSELICAQAHLRALHGGTQLTMRLIR